MRQEKMRNFYSGMFMATGLICIVLFIFMVGKDKGIGQPTFKISILYRQIAGLIEGAPVRLSGVTIGKVDTIDFLDNGAEERRVKVVLNIRSKHKQLFIDHQLKFSIQTAGVLGEKLIEISILGHGQKVNLNHPFIGEDPLDVSDVTVEISNAARSFTKTAEALNKIDMAKISGALLETSDALLLTSEGINDILKELQETARKSKRLVDRLEQKLIEGNLFKVF